ncbi:MAG: PEP/pyruvate-binding domain-containing protein [bacterium]|nr:PEP/pyruvate-binding domain-containing protein [bacterium]
MSEIIHSHRISLAQSEIGGKARGLLFLQSNKFETPPFYILDYNSLSEISSGSTTLNSLLHKWVSSYSIDTASLWAVRSSADNEDGLQKSFAGFFNTVTNVKLHELEGAIQKVLASYATLVDQNYTSQKKAEFGIIIQEMIRPDYSGVVFSHNPSNMKDETIFINVVPGLGENLVSGKEEAFSITYAKGKFSYLNVEDSFHGKKYTTQLTDISKSGHQIRTDLSAALPQLIRGTQLLYKLKKVPLDIEFCIALGKIYWLQVRPITTGELEPFIWDNTAAEGNYPGTLLPLSSSLIKRSFYLAYSNMARFIGMPVKLLKTNDNLLQQMIGEIDGGLYYNVTAWQKLIYQLPFGKKASTALPGIWGMEPADFFPEKNESGIVVKPKLLLNLLISLFSFISIRKKYLVHHATVHAQFEKIDLTKKEHEQLSKLYIDLETQLTSNWEAPMLNNFFAVTSMMLLKKLVNNSRLQLKYPNFINDALFAQGDVISVTIIREFQALLKDIKKEPAMLNLFLQREAADLYRELPATNIILFNKIKSYIQKFGERSSDAELKMETINYREDPLRFIIYLKENLRYDHGEDKKAPAFNYAEVLKSEYRINLLKRIFFMQLVKLTITRLRDRENFRFMRTKTYSLVRRIFRTLDQDLLSKNLISEANDSLYLKLNEITEPQQSSTYKDLILKRKHEFEIYKAAERSTRYIQTGTQFIQAEPVSLSAKDSVIRGIGCCSGIVKARIKIVSVDFLESESISGKILVANYFEPGKLHLFSLASGLISVRGNLLGHTAILCREMGIPSIVGTKGLLAYVKDGDLIEMNGGTGKITLLSQHE